MDSDKHDNVILPKMLTAMLDQHHDAYFIKGLDSRYIYVNSAVVKKVGLRSINDFLDKTENDIKSKMTENEEIVKEWQWQDRKVIESRRKITTLEINPSAVDHPYIVRKIPFYNERNICVGVLTYCKNLDSVTPNEFINGKKIGSFLLTRPSSFFTELECEIVFLNLQGQTVKSIANRFVCSESSIQSALLQIYSKAGVSHFDDFSEFCEKKGYHRYLPKRFFETYTVAFDKHVIYES